MGNSLLPYLPALNHSLTLRSSDIPTLITSLGHKHTYLIHSAKGAILLSRKKGKKTPLISYLYPCNVHTNLYHCWDQCKKWLVLSGQDIKEGGRAENKIHSLTPCSSWLSSQDEKASCFPCTSCFTCSRISGLPGSSRKQHVQKSKVFVGTHSCCTFTVYRVVVVMYIKANCHHSIRERRQRRRRYGSKQMKANCQERSN